MTRADNQEKAPDFSSSLYIDVFEFINLKHTDYRRDSHEEHRDF